MPDRVGGVRRLPGQSAALTRYDVEIVRALVSGNNEEAIRLAREFGLLPVDGVADEGESRTQRS